MVAITRRPGKTGHGGTVGIDGAIVWRLFRFGVMAAAAAANGLVVRDRGAAPESRILRVVSLRGPVYLEQIDRITAPADLTLLPPAFSVQNGTWSRVLPAKTRGGCL